MMLFLILIMNYWVRKLLQVGKCPSKQNLSYLANGQVGIKSFFEPCKAVLQDFKDATNKQKGDRVDCNNHWIITAPYCWENSFEDTD